MPFSSGKRICLGENLAKTELFLITTSVFQSFKIVPDPDSPKPSLEAQVNGIVAVTKPHQLVFHER